MEEVGVLMGAGFSCVVWIVVDREPHPRIVPIMMCSQGVDSIGQLSVASFQIADCSGLQHLSRMCSRVSVLSWQREHHVQCLCIGMLLQKSLILRE